MGKPDLFSRTYENLDQELKNACLKYEQAQARKGLRVTRVALIYTPKEAPYFEIDVDEEVKIKGQKVSIPPEPRAGVRPRCVHPSTICNGLGKLECILCDAIVRDCDDSSCAKCRDDADSPPTLRSARFPVVEVAEDDEGESR